MEKLNDTDSANESDDKKVILDKNTENVDETEDYYSDGENSGNQGSSKEAVKVENMSEGANKLRSWLNKTFRVQMSDGRVLLGVFLCTDRDRNIILGSCSEYLPPKDGSSLEPPEEPRVLGLVMVPGKHIVSIHLDELGVNAPPESNDAEEASNYNYS